MLDIDCIDLFVASLPKDIEEEETKKEEDKAKE